MKDADVSSVLVAVNVSAVAFSAIVVADSVISVGAALLPAAVAAADTVVASVRVIEPDPDPAIDFSAAAAVATLSG